MKEVIFNENFLHLKKWYEHIKYDFSVSLVDCTQRYDDAVKAIYIELEKTFINGLKVNILIVDDVDRGEKYKYFKIVLSKGTDNNFISKIFKVKNNNWKKAYLELLNYGIRQKLV